MLRLASALSLLALACACTSMGGGPAPLSVADYGPILNAPERTEADKKDDAARKPAEILAFARIAPGQTILELEGGRGWYSDILSEAIGPTGKLIIQYPPEFGYGDAAYKTRMDAGRLKNARIIKSHFDTYDVASGSVDKVLWILGPHEVYFSPAPPAGSPAPATPVSLGDPAKTYAEIMRVLKPGGEFIAMDHAADKGAPTSVGGTIHRIDPAVVMDSAKKAGFKFVDESKILANPSDDRTVRVFDATIRRHTDQFLYRFVKP